MIAGYPKRLVTKIIVLLACCALAGCSKKAAEEAAETTFWVVAAVPLVPIGIVTYPFWHDPMMGVDQSVIVAEHGEPTAKYDCDGDEMWEYSSEQFPSGNRFLMFSSAGDSSVRYRRRNIDLLNECTLKSGAPTPKTTKAFYATALPCGEQYIKQTEKQQRFLLDMGVNEGVSEVEYYHINGTQFTVFEIYYEGAIIFARPETILGRSHTMQKATIEYGPGISNLLEVRITGLKPRPFKLTVACPQSSEK